MKSGIWSALAVALAALCVTACSGSGEAEQTEAGPKGDVTVSDGRMFLAPVRGNPAAVYFTLANQGGADRTVTKAQVQGARTASLHHTMTSGEMSSMHELPGLGVPAGETVVLAPGGMHVMAEGLEPRLMPGGTTQVTLTFSDGQTVSFPAEIYAAGDAR
jgi:copper(I)-binding protein